MAMNKKLEELEEIIGYHFKNKHYLVQAMTHSSYANEKKLGKLGSNERLEFLGDAVLELISSDFLYEKFPQVPEGELTKKGQAWYVSQALHIAQENSVFPNICSLAEERI